jgi:hypothetical protein
MAGDGNISIKRDAAGEVDAAAKLALVSGGAVDKCKRCKNRKFKSIRLISVGTTCGCCVTQVVC